MRALLPLLLASAASAAVIGIDFGGRFLKVGIIQPGAGIELVLNEASKRKSSAAAGFNSQGERVYGDESQNLLGKLPQQQFVLAKLLLGKPVDSAEVASFTEMLHPYEFLHDEDTRAALVRHGANETFRGEELVAFVLSYAKQISEAHAGSAIKDCVITIPPYFDHIQRAAMINAAAIAGLNVLSLMHENTAFAFKYGFDKESEFSPEPTNVVFYDLGATSFKVSVVSFSTTVGKKNKTTGAMSVLGVACDETLGGRFFDQVVLDILADKFNEQLKGDDVRKHSRAIGKLRKEAERVKDVLSANQQFQVAVESVHDDRDLRMVISRNDFEERAEAAGLWARLRAPLAEALRQANLTKEEVHRVEVVGGATRIPRVKEMAKEFFGRPQLDASINGDEAAALGATLYAAKLSTSFRLRDFAITDAFPRAINIRLAGGEEVEEEGEAAGKGKDKLLFKANSKFPHKKLITMTRAEDLFVTLAYRDDGSPIASFNITGVGAAVERMAKDPTKTQVGKPKVSVTFALTSNGLLEVSKAELALEMLEKYDDFELVPSNDTSAAPAAEPNATANGSNGTNSSGMVKVKVERERKRLHYTTLAAAKAPLGAVLPINASHVAACIARNKRMLADEEARRRDAEVKNALEAFIIDTRDRLGDEAVGVVSTEEEREALRALLDAAEEWLYEEGRSLGAPAYASKKGELDGATAPLLLRLSEMEARPAVVSKAREAVNWTRTILAAWAEERPEVTAAERAHAAAMCDNFTAWLDGVLEEQAALPAHAPPAFLSAAVTAKLEPLEKEVRRLIKKPKPKPKKPPANATNGSAANGSATNGSAANGSATGGEEAAADGEEPDLPKHDEL
ncbi:hypothetical protein AB1Y20_016997 [Prymnesium parvum]